jgi:DNA-binding NtrC family response regulator/CHASE2 domain-containing sensor protein
MTFRTVSLARAVALAGLIALAATSAVAAVRAVGGASLTPLEWSAYDRWLRQRGTPPPSPALVLVVRDPASEARFGGGAWDRAVLARVVTNLTRAGARVVGVDLTRVPPGAAASGGATGEALLGEATASAGNVVYPIALEPLRQPPSSLVQRAKAVGHVLAPPDADGVVRRLPLAAPADDRTVPAFAVALATAFLGPALGRVPADDRGRVLVGFTGPGLPGGVVSMPFSEVWAAIESRSDETLQRLVEDRLVLVLAEPESPPRATPVGAMSDVAIQAHLLDSLLTKAVPRLAPATWAIGWAFLLAALAAGLALALPWWAALLGGAALVAVHGVAVVLALARAALVLPVWPPPATIVVAAAVALAVRHHVSTSRLRQLEGENARVREALVRHESAVEALEEDLDAARVAVARSTGAERELARAADALRSQLVEARAQEEQTRRHLAEVERELRGLRPVETAAEAGDGAQEALRRECQSLGIVTADAGVLALFADLKKAAGAALPVLLLGEPGTGKELFARAAHRLGPRAARAFVAVNMAAIPPELFESELFGHVKGSFTGAVADRKGYFEQADGGTIFLDEIGELRPDHQSKLLRVLQDHTFHRVGASRSTSADVRVIAATNRDLERAVAEGRFREDLYFRLKGLVLRLPPLRERPADVPLLAAHLFAAAAADAGRTGLRLSEEAVVALRAHDWPGNVRELDNVLRRAVALADGAVVSARDLRLPARASVPARSLGEARGETAGDEAVLACLRRHRFDMQATGRALGWDRSTVTQRLKGIGFRALVEHGGDREKAALSLAGDQALARTVALKLREYHEHLLRSIEGFDSADAAVAACRRRFKNLPERHFRFLESLVRRHLDRRPPAPTA